MSEYDPLEAGLTDRELIESALSSPESLGHLLLMDLKEEAEPFSDHEERCLTLLDLQKKHAETLQSEGVLWRAYADATTADPCNPQKPLLDINAPFRACVYRLQGLRGGVHTEIGGVRFIVTRLRVDGKYAEENVDVPVYVNDKHRRAFTRQNTDVVMGLVGELETYKEELRLSEHGLAKVLRP